MHASFHHPHFDSSIAAVHSVKADGTGGLIEYVFLCLNREKQIISLQGNCLAFLAVTFLMGYVEDYLGVNVSEA
jgi:hypothetical protein